MQIGISSFGTGVDNRETIALAVEAEAAGFDRFMLVERVLTNDAVTQLAAIAARTSRIGIGTGIVNIWLRHPEMLAAAAAAVADISAGRLVLGLGPNNPRGAEAVGATWRDPRDALSDVTVQLREIFAGTSGRLGPTAYPIPLPWAAVALETVTRAAQEADGVMLYLTSVARAERAAQRFRTAAVAAGRNGPAGLECSLLLPVFLHDDLAVARAAARHHLTMYSKLPAYQKMLRASGFEDPEGLSDELVDAIVAAGPVARISERLAEFEATGLTHVDLAPLPVGGEGLANSARRVIAAFGPGRASPHDAPDQSSTRR